MLEKQILQRLRFVANIFFRNEACIDKCVRFVSLSPFAT